MRSALASALTGGLIWTGLALAPARALAADGAEKALPANTLAYLKIENAAKLRQAFKASQFGQMIADPAMQPLKDDFKAKMEDSSQKLKAKLGVSIRELMTLPQGAVNIAVVGREAKEGKAPVALLASVDAGENAAKMAEVMAKVGKLAEEKGANVATESFKESKLTTIREADGNKDPLVWTQVGSIFHVSSDPDALKDYLSNASGRTQSLAASDSYQGVLKGIGEDPQAVFFADVAQLIKLAIASNPGGNADQMMAQVQLLGLDSFKALGGSFSFGKGEYDQVTKLFFYAPGPAQGILKIFAMPPIDLTPQAWVPATILSYQSFSWDLDAAWTAIAELAEQNGFAGFIDQAQRGIDANGGFDFAKDLFGPIGDRITALSDLKKPINEKSQRALFALELEDEKAFQSTFNKILELTQASPKTREFQGVKIYDFDVPEIPNAGAAGMNIEGPISVAITKGNLFVSTAPEFLEQVLRPGGKPLGENADFQAVAAKLPAKTSVLSFDRTEEQARVLYDMIKSGGLQQAIDQANANNQGEQVKNPIDPAKIPDFSVFAKYLGQGGSYGIMNEQGLTITSFTLRKAQP